MVIHIIVGVYHGVVDKVLATLDETTVPRLKKEMETWFGDDKECDISTWQIKV